MYLAPAPPQPVPIVSKFDYVAVDAQRRRVYAAHTGSQALLIVNADSGAVLGQVDVGGHLHGVAVDVRTGMVFTGDGDGQTVSEVDPKTMQVKTQVNLPKPIDAIAFDPKYDRVYADEDSGNHVYVIDAAKMQLVGAVITPGDDHEYLAIDPKNGDVYQNIPGINVFAVIDPASLRVVKTVKTPELKDNHPLQFDSANSTVVVGGKNGVLSVYNLQGMRLGTTKMPAGTDQCDLDSGSGMLACAAEGTITLFSVRNASSPKLLAKLVVGQGAHTVAIDPRTHALWTVLVAPHGDYVQRINVVP